MLPDLCFYRFPITFVAISPLKATATTHDEGWNCSNKFVEQTLLIACCRRVECMAHFRGQIFPYYWNKCVPTRSKMWNIAWNRGKKEEAHQRDPHLLDKKLSVHALFAALKEERLRMFLRWLCVPLYVPHSSSSCSMFHGTFLSGPGKAMGHGGT